jgi:hypothetical protein
MYLMLDLIQTEVQNKILIEVKVMYIHLAIRAYNPVAQQMQGEKRHPNC